MQEAVPAGIGAMAAIIGCDEAVAEQICKEAVLPNEILSPANFNSIGQIVIAGHKASVEAALPLAKEKGAKMAVLLPVSVPSHCQLMMPAAEKLKINLNQIDFHSPSISIINNVGVKAYNDAASIRDGLSHQLYMPVRWVEIIKMFISDGITQIIECGPGKVLTGLNKRIESQLELMSTSDIASLNALLQHERSA